MAMSRVWKFWSLLDEGWEQAGRVLDGERCLPHGLRESRCYILWLIFVYLLTTVRKFYSMFQPLNTRLQSTYARFQAISSALNFVCQRTDICNCCGRKMGTSSRNRETQTNSSYIQESGVESTKSPTSSRRTSRSDLSPLPLSSISGSSKVSSIVLPVEASTSSRILDAARASDWNTPSHFKVSSPEAKDRSKLDKFRDAISSGTKRTLEAACVSNETTTSIAPLVSQRSSLGNSGTTLKKGASRDPSASNSIGHDDHSYSLRSHTQSWKRVLRLRFNKQENTEDEDASGRSEVLTCAPRRQFAFTQSADVIEIHPITGMNRGYSWHLSLQLAFEREYRPCPVVSYRGAAPIAFLLWIFQRLGLIQHSESEYSSGQPASVEAECKIFTLESANGAEIVIREPALEQNRATIAVSYESDAQCKPVPESSSAEQEIVPSSCESEESVECVAEPCKEATRVTNDLSLELGERRTISCESMNVIEQACNEAVQEIVLDELTSERDATPATSVESARPEPTDQTDILQEPTSEQESSLDEQDALHATVTASDAINPIIPEPTDEIEEMILRQPTFERDQEDIDAIDRQLDVHCKPINYCTATKTFASFDLPSEQEDATPSCESESPACNQVTNLEQCNETERGVPLDCPSEQNVDVPSCEFTGEESMPIKVQEPNNEAQKASATDECSSEHDAAPKASNTKASKKKARKRNKDRRKW